MSAHTHHDIRAMARERAYSEPMEEWPEHTEPHNKNEKGNVFDPGCLTCLMEEAIEKPAI
jgi:hypothetical protein